VRRAADAARQALAREHGRAAVRRMPRLALAWAVFIVYGSLVPLEYRWRPLEEALAAFAAAPFLELGVQQRADWVANGVLYFPLGFLLCSWLWSEWSGARRVLAVAVALLAGVLLAVAVEFAQLYFPPRTVSRNDVLAEWIGTALGALAWSAGGGQALARALGHIRAGTREALRGALLAYLIGYCVLALFPFDFLGSLDELTRRFAERPPRWGPPAGACLESLRCLLKVPIEVLATVPLGVLWALASRARPAPLGRALALGAVLGVVVEGLQLLTYSGQGEALSVLTRALGVAAGVLLPGLAGTAPVRAVAARPRRLVALLAVPYLVLLAVLNGWQQWPPLAPGALAAKLLTIHYVPFYYHYYTSENQALLSLGRNLLAYAPVGLAAWAWARSGGRATRALATALGAALGALMWAGRMALSPHYADPTNVLIAALGAALGWTLLDRVAAWSGAASGASPAVPVDAPPGRLPVRRAGAALLAALAVAGLWSHPLGAALGAALALYALLLARSPRLWLVLVPALLPALDLSRSAGLRLVEEGDLLVAVTLAVLLWTGQPASLARDGLARPLVGLLGLSYLVALTAGLGSPAVLAGPGFAGYLDPGNALRVAKGFVVALLLWPFLGPALAERGRLRLLIAGVLLGLAIVEGTVLLERLRYAGLLDLGAEFRVAGPFAGMGVGGQLIDAYLVAALPFAAWVLLRARGPGPALAGAALFAGALYAVVVTVSRWTYLVAGVELLVLWGGLLLAAGPGARRALVLRGALVVTLAALALGAVLGGESYARERFAGALADVARRAAHWGELLALRASARERWLGIGLGALPRALQAAAAPGQRPARVELAEQAGNRYLRLEGGAPLYLDQRIGTLPAGEVRVSLALRGTPGARVALALCEKSVMYSFACRWTRFTVAEPAGAWRRQSRFLDPGGIGARGGRFPSRPAVLSLVPPGPGERAEVDSISLRDSDGRERLANGDFSAGLDGWLPSSDQQGLWRADNLAVHLLVEQGRLGLLAFALLALYVLARLAAALGRGEAGAALLGAAIGGFLLEGAVASLLDAPRVAALGYLLLFTALAVTRPLSAGLAAAAPPVGSPGGAGGRGVG